MGTTTNVWTKEMIIAEMDRSDEWLYHGLLAIYAKQTAAEQQVEETVEDNGVGFTGFDGELLSSFAKQLQQRGFLTPKQRVVARNRMRKYGRQLAGIANGVAD